MYRKIYKMNLMTNQNCPIKFFPKCECSASIIINAEEWSKTKERRLIMINQFKQFHGQFKKHIYLLSLEVEGGMLDEKVMTYNETIQWMLRYQLPASMREVNDYDPHRHHCFCVPIHPNPLLH